MLQLFVVPILIIAFGRTAAAGQYGCPNDWTRHDQSCYYKLPQTYSHVKGRKICSSFSSHLVTLNTVEEKDWVMKHVVGSVWTSMRDVGYNGTFTWSDGYDVVSDVVTWDANLVGTGDCGAFQPHTGTFFRFDCNYSIIPGCQYASTNGHCASSYWVFHKDSCYFIPLNSDMYKTTKAKMLHVCKTALKTHGDSIDVTPLKIDSKELMDKFKILKMKSAVWTGLKMGDDGNFVWDDGTELDTSFIKDFKQPYIGEPNHPQYCVIMNKWGYFRTGHCDQRKDQIICEQESPYNGSSIDSGNTVTSHLQFMTLCTVFVVLYTVN